MSDSRQHIHELIDELDAGQLAAVGQLLEVMIHDDDEEMTEADRAAIQAGLASLDKNGGIPMEELLADFGLTAAEFEKEVEFEKMAAEPQVEHTVTKHSD